MAKKRGKNSPATAPARQGVGVAHPLFAGESEMAALMRSIDWPQTPIGPVETWSPALRMVIKLMLANRFPMILWWGPQFVQFYNDSYRPIPGNKHPRSMGQPASECWSEIWHVIGPLIERPFNGGPATWDDDILLEIHRHGFVEECHFTIAYSPVPDETAPSGIGGVLATVHEISGKVVGDRRVVVLRDLGTQSAEARTAEDACALAARTLAGHSKDIPFALLYLIDADRKHARLAGVAGVAAGQPASPSVINLADEEADRSPWPLKQALEKEAVLAVSDLASQLEGQVPPGPWSDPPNTAVVVPIRSTKAHYLAGFLVAGVSARLQLDQQYRDFFDLVSSQIAAAIANARDYEEEKKRAEALAEIDRAKTAFFSNISHEFRTPLTLILGPVEELLAKSHTDLSPAAKGQLEVAHRNSLRLLRLVNTLLDFSRLEAGRVRAVFEPTDLGAFTGELASMFRAATERAGLRLVVDCPALAEPVYVDRDMWEKIVLNLVSNAFKFTFEGEIEVKLRAEGSSAVLSVRDTGVGIPAEAMPRLFERFYRAQNTRSRTHEGSGIGLALVQELVKLHNGSVRAESRLGQGTTFFVSVALGKAHLPPDKLGAARSLASTATGAAPFVEEALRWLPDAPARPEPELPAHAELMAAPCPPGQAEQRANRPRVLVADDNADMRYYVTRLLAERYSVQAVPDGTAALAAVQERCPDLILSDVMMPGLDGIELVQRLRADPKTRTIPILLLSARAGEEARVEGLKTGADDYLIKPFSARELIARVQTQLELARVRREADQAVRESRAKLKAAFASMTEAIFIADAEGRLIDFNDGFVRYHRFKNREECSRTIADCPRYLDAYFQDGTPAPLEMWAMSRALRGETASDVEYMLHRKDSGETWWGSYNFAPIRDEDGRIVGAVVAGREITERKRAEEVLKLTQASVDGSPEMVVWFTPDGSLYYANDAACRTLGYSREELLRMNALDFSPGFTREQYEEHWREVRRRKSFTLEPRHRRKDGSTYTAEVLVNHVLYGGQEFIFAYGRDITERKRAEEQLRESELRYSALFGNKINGMAHCRVITDEQGKPVDYWILQINGAYERIIGIKKADIEGRRATEVFPDIKNYAFDYIGVYGKVALERGEIKFEEFFEATQQHLSIYAYSPLPGEFTAIFTDVTKRKQAEEALHESRERLTWILDTTGVGLWLNPLPLGRLKWDHRTCELFFIPSGVEPTVELFWQRLYPEDRESTRLAIEAALRDHTLYAIDHRALNPVTGEVRWIRSAGQATYAADGTPTRFDGINYDITERKRGEEALGEHRELLEAVINSLPMHVNLMRGSDLRLQFVNPAYQALAPGKEMVGRTLGEVWPETGQDFAALCRRVLETGETYYVEDQLNRIRRQPDGPLEECYFSWSLLRVRLPGEKGWGILNPAWDTTARHQAEAALRKSEERFRRVFSNNMVPMALWTKDGGIVDANDALLGMLGYARTELGAGDFRWDAITPADYRQRDLEAIGEVDAKGFCTPYEKCWRHKDGRLVPIVMGAGKFDDHAGTGVLFAVDITERKRAEEALKLSLHEKEVMLREIHHRVKNNLQVIASLVDLQTDALANPAFKAVFQDVRDRVRSMALVHEKLYQSESLARVDFAEYAESLLSYLVRSHRSAECAIALKTELQPVTFSVEVAVPCGLILNELVSNAIKHAFRGRAEGAITTALGSRPDGRVFLRVSDNGVGLPAGMDWRQSRSMGLRLIQLLAKQLNATVEVRVNGGTEFEIAFAPKQSEERK